MPKRILVPLKFSTVCEGALAMGLRLARCCEARLHILHVLDYHLRSPEVTDEQIAEISTEAEKKFQQVYLPLLTGFKNFSFNCWEGDPPVETANFAETIGADFIVIGCHWRGDSPSPIRYGEFALTLLQWSPCPVMLVPSPPSRKKSKTVPPQTIFRDANGR